MAQIFSPQPFKDYFRFVHQATWQNEGEEFENIIGDIESLGGTAEFQDIEREGRDYAYKTTTAIHTIGSKYNISFTALSISRLMAQAIFMDNDGEFANQAAASNLTKTFTNLKKGRIYNLGRENVELNSTDDGDEETPIAFVEGTHFRLHAESGRLELLAVPVGATQLVVDFDAAAITDEDDIAVYGGMSDPGKNGTLRLYGISNIGQNFIFEFYRCRLRPAGELTFQGVDEYSNVPFEIRVFADGTKPEKYRYFRVRELKG